MSMQVFAAIPRRNSRVRSRAATGLAMLQLVSIRTDFRDNDRALTNICDAGCALPQIEPRALASATHFWTVDYIDADGLTR